MIIYVEKCKLIIQKYNLSALLLQSILVLLCLVSYHHAISGATFVFDDTVAIVKNKDVIGVPTNWTAIFSNDFWGSPLQSVDSHKSYRPLTTLMFHIEYGLLGLQAPHMKLLNLLLHCVNTLLVWRVIRNIHIKDMESDSERLATITAALFAVHPVHTEAVAGVVGRAELMFCLLYLFSLIVTLKEDSTQWSNITMVILLSAVGMLFKETAVTIPMSCIFVDYMQRAYYMQPFKQQWRLITLRRYMTYGFATICLIITRLWRQDFVAPQFKTVDNPVAFDKDLFTRILSQHYLYAVNLWIMLCPQWLSFDWALGCIKLVNNIWDLRLQAVLACYSLFIVTMLNFKRCVGVIYSLGLLVIPFLPATGIIKVGFVIAERILYVPSIGFCLLIAYAFIYCFNEVAQTKPMRLVFKCFMMLIFTSLLLRTRQRALDWVNEQRLFESALNICPNNAKVHYNIARLATDQKHFHKALQHYHKAIDLHPEYESALMNLGNLYREQGALETAEQYIRSALKAQEVFPVAWMNLGIVQAALKKYADAEASYKTALKYRKNYAVCYYNLGNLYLEQKRYNKAMQHWQHAIALNPHQPKAWSNILTLLDNQALYADALQLSEKALSYLPKETNILFIRANVFGKLNKFIEAERLYKEILKVEPYNLMYYTNLGVLYHRWDKTNAAIEAYKKAIELDSKNKAQTARDNLGKLLKRLALEQKQRDKMDH